MRARKKVPAEASDEVKKRVAGKVDMQLGKGGISEEFINEVRNRLEKHGVVKIRVLKSYRRAHERDIEDIAREVAERSGGRIYEIRGFTFILVRERGPG